MSAETCQYTKVKSDPWGDDWLASCDYSVRCEAPMQVGISFAPLPNDGGQTFCSFCGKRIEILKKDPS